METAVTPSVKGYALVLPPSMQIASDKWALSGVLALWAAMSSVVLGCVAMYGHSVPLVDEWDIVPALTGQEQNLPHWLWAQHEEHRSPFPKAVFLVLLRISGGDLRIGIIANTLMLAGLSLAMILTARRIRGGQTRLADTFFPLALLHLGHWENMVWGWQIVFVIPTVLVCVWLLIIVRCPWPLPPKIAVTAGLTTVLLPLSMAIGLIFTPFVALWLAAGTLLYQRSTSPRWVVPYPECVCDCFNRVRLSLLCRILLTTLGGNSSPLAGHHNGGEARRNEHGPRPRWWGLGSRPIRDLSSSSRREGPP
jgi:hypothetical protein